MTVHKIAGEDAAGYSGYLASVDPTITRRGDYYLSPVGEQIAGVGVWHGKAAAELGLTGEVTREQMLRVWEGKDPATGEILIRRSAQGEHVAAVDCTFSAPKSVSVVWALASPEHRAELEAAQSRATTTALDHIEAGAPLVRRRIGGEVRHEHAAGLAVARFRHHTSRLCAEQHEHGHAPDPQLHDHCAIANLALRSEDALDKKGGRWAAVDSRELYRIAAEAGAVYRAELAAELMRMGYRVHRQGRYFEITGVSKEVQRTFSVRAQEVEAATARFVAKHGRRPTDEEARNLVVLSRQPKAGEHGPAFAQWQERAATAGVTRDDMARLRGRSIDLDGVTGGNELIAEATVRALAHPDGPHSLTKSAAVFDERALRIATAEMAQGRIRGSEVASLINAASQSPELVKLDAVHRTTQTMLDTEHEVLLAARVKALSTQGFSAKSSSVRDALTNARVALSQDQQDAARALMDGRGLALITAPAGAGKGEVLRVATAAYQRDGRRVIALAAAGETAQRLQQETGADEARTIDSFIHQMAQMSPEQKQQQVQDCVLVVDEAGLLETTRWHKLLHATEGAKVIAAGDAAQLSPIEAGGLWSVLEKRLGAATLSENYRAREQWARDAWTALREGQSLDALRAFEERGLLVVADDRLAARAAAVDAWDHERQGTGLEKVLLLTDSSNAEVDALNAAAQQRRLAAGELAPEAVPVVTMYRDSLVAREEQLHPGDVVTFERRLYPTVEQQQRDERGDIRAARRVENGEAGVITGVDTGHQTVTVQLRDREVTLQPDQLDALRLGYAQHVYSAQGRTVDQAFVVLGGWQTDRENSYVGVSRSRENTFVFSDYSSLDVEKGQRELALQELSERFTQSRAKVAATALGDRVREHTHHRGPDMYTDTLVALHRRGAPEAKPKGPQRYGPKDGLEPADRAEKIAQLAREAAEDSERLRRRDRAELHRRGPELDPDYHERQRDRSRGYDMEPD